MNVLFVSPRTPDTFWSFRHALPFISKRSDQPPLGLLTVAAMLPRSWSLKLIDLNVTELSDEQILWADYVMIGGMIIHRSSATEVARRCRELERPVIAGGPLFATSMDSFPDIDHFVLGEAEDLMPTLVRDMESRCVQKVYEIEDRPDLSRSPVPRWDLIDFRHYASLSIQFCRGCPFDCEFCDVIVMNGRVPRMKSPAQIIEELETLRLAGWKGPVFFVDDNFIGNKRRVRELLRELITWRRGARARMDFCTEASVDLAAYPDILQLMVDAGFKRVFVGIETPDPENLKACNKLQNTRCDLLQSMRTIQAAGLEVMGGFIIGFDRDNAGVFRRQFTFIQRAGIVTAMVGLLTALPRTRLYRRLVSEGRILDESGGNNTEATCNFETSLARDELIAGYRRLMRKLYEPNTYYRRARILLRNWRPRGPRAHTGPREVGALFRSLWELGVLRSGRRPFWRFIGHTLLRHPRAFGLAVTIAIYGHHFRTVARSL